MMKKLSIILIILLVLFVGCEMNDLTNVENDGFALVAEGISADSNARTAGGSNGLKLSFRSSDIEFWATGGEYTNLVSTKFVDNETTKNESIEITLSDSLNNVTFMPNHVNINNGYEMPDFDIFATYDIVRLDIGGGNIDLTKNGNPVDVKSTKLNDSTNLNANSIILVDSNIMSEAHYISQNEMYNVDNHDYGVDDNFIKTFIANKAIYNENGWSEGIDMDGAILLPFNSVKFNGNKVTKVSIKLKWNMDNIFDENYNLRETADGTPYNFDIEVEIK